MNFKGLYMPYITYISLLLIGINFGLLSSNLLYHNNKYTNNIVNTNNNVNLVLENELEYDSDIKPWTNSILLSSHPHKTIPNIVHFVHGYKSKDPPFLSIHYLSIRSAYHILNVTTIYFHYYHEPNSIWFNKTKFEFSDKLQLIKARSVDHVYGRNITHHAHKADIIRLEALLKYGGIYLDIDMIVTKSFDNLLIPTKETPQEMIMGYEKLSDKNYTQGIANAVIIANKHSTFLKEWYKSYYDWFEKDWSYFSVKYVKRMADAKPHLIRVLPYDAFFTPVWDTKGIKQLYIDNNYNFLNNNYAIHLWTHILTVGNNIKIGKQLDTLNINDICSLQTTFGRLLRHVLHYELGAEYRFGNLTKCDNIIIKNFHDIK